MPPLHLSLHLSSPSPLLLLGQAPWPAFSPDADSCTVGNSDFEKCRRRDPEAWACSAGVAVKVRLKKQFQESQKIILRHLREARSSGRSTSGRL